MKRLLILAVMAGLVAACDTMHYSPIDEKDHAAMHPKATGSPMDPSHLQVWVDDLDLTKAEQGWNTTNKNLSAENNPVTLKGKTFAHAVGTHAPGKIVIDLKGAAKTFTATVGIDDDSEDEGSAGFIVIGDGKVLKQTGNINRQDPVQKISVDLTGVQQLVLYVDTGENDNPNNDHTDWAEALITLDPAKVNIRPEVVDASKAKLPPGLN